MTSLTSVLRLRGVSSPAPEPETAWEPQDARTEDPGPVAAAHPAAPSGDTAQMSPAGWLRGVRRKARDTSQQDGHWVRDGLAGRPCSVDQQRAHLANRGWLDPGHENGIADRAGEAFLVAVGIPGVAAGNLVSWLCARPLRFIWALAAWPLVSFTALRLGRVPLHVAAGAMSGVLRLAHIPVHGAGAVALDPDIAVIAWAGLVALLLAARRAWHRSRNPQEN